MSEAPAARRGSASRTSGGSQRLRRARRAWQALVEFLDSGPVSRIGAITTVVAAAGTGLGIVATIYLEASDVIHTAGWIPLIAFALWLCVTSLLTAAAISRRQIHSLWSPLDRLVMLGGFAVSDQVVARALTDAERLSREYVAEAAVLQPALDGNHADVARLVQAYLDLEAEVARILAATDRLDDRWQLLWSMTPGQKPLGEMGLACRAMLDDVTAYMAQRTRQLQWMLEFLRTGDDRPVKYVQLWARHPRDESSQRSAPTPLA